jgi:hypothetical protein
MRNPPVGHSERDDGGTRVRFTRMHPIGVTGRWMGIHLAAVERRGSTPLIERSPGADERGGDSKG